MVVPNPIVAREFPVSKRKKCLIIVAGVVAFFVVLGIIGSATDSSQPDADSTPAPPAAPTVDAATATPTPEPTAAPTPEPTATPTATPTPEPTPTPLPTATSTPVPPIHLEGVGTRTERVELVAGLWTVQASVAGNQDCTFGSCYPTNFIVQIESVDDGSFEGLVNEIGAAWSGSTTLRVGEGFLALMPGRQVVSVDASGAWTLDFTRE